MGNGATSILQSPNMTWNNTSNIISASNFVGSGASLTPFNASNITTGTLSVNGTSLTSLKASNVTSGILIVSGGGIGTTSLISNQILVEKGKNAINQASPFFI
jgi:hypothetical protein